MRFRMIANRIELLLSGSNASIMSWAIKWAMCDIVRAKTPKSCQNPEIV